MRVYWLRIVCTEIYKTNPGFMNNIFKVKENKRLIREQYKLNLQTPKWNQVTLQVKLRWQLEILAVIQFA